MQRQFLQAPCSHHESEWRYLETALTFRPTGAWNCSECSTATSHAQVCVAQLQHTLAPGTENDNSSLPKCALYQWL